MKKLLIAVVMLLGGLTTLSAQIPLQGQALEDVIYLNDGAVLRGIIVEQIPAVSYVITTANGATYKVDALSINKITKEPVRQQIIVAEEHAYLFNTYVPHKYDEDGNVIFPLDPLESLGWSLIIPGSGQMYNGQWGKGALLMAGTLLGSLGVLVGTEMVSSKYEDLVGYPSIALAVGCYLYSLFDAPIYAIKWNKAQGFKGGVHNYMNISPVVGVAGGHGAMGLNIAVGF